MENKTKVKSTNTSKTYSNEYYSQLITLLKNSRYNNNNLLNTN